MRKLSLFFFITALFGLFSCSGPEVTNINNGIQVKTDSAVVQIQFYKDNIVRVMKTPDSFEKKSLIVIVDTLPAVDFKLKTTRKTVSLETESLIVEVCTKTGAVSYKQNGNVVLKEKNYPCFTNYESANEKAYSVAQNFELTQDEALYGLGQHQNGFMNYRGKEVTLVQTNTDAVIPFLWSTAGYGILWDNYSKTIVSDSEAGCKIWSDVADNLDYYVIVDEKADNVISGYRFLTGKAPMFGKWAYGYWQCKEHYHTQEEILNIARKYRKYGYPCDVIIQDWNYWNGQLDWGSMSYDKQRYPDAKALNDELHEKNFHSMISVWPAIGPDAKKMYNDFESKGFLFNKVGWAGFKYYDAYNPEAVNLYYEYLKNGLAVDGWDGWWFDSTEPDITNALTKPSTEYDLKTTGKNHLGSFDRYLNPFSLVELTQLHDLMKADALKKENPQRQYILTRSTFAGQQRAAAVTWSGDIGAAWDIYQNQITAGLNHCMSGVPYWTFDIGAFVLCSYEGVFSNEKKDPAYQELYTRMFQFCTFCPIFRSHGSETPREIWEFGEFTPTLVKFDQLRYRLLPYIYTQAWKIYSEDYTLMRGLAFDFPKDKNVYNLKDEYMFGPSILVAPVTEQQKYRAPQRSVEVPVSAFTTKDGKPGLHAMFYKDNKYENLACDTVVEQINVHWYCERPYYATDSMFAIRYDGYLTVPETGKYRFHIKNFDSKRMFIDGKEIQQTEGGTEKYTEYVTLEAGKKYEFLLETENSSSGAARTILCWKTPSMLAEDAAPLREDEIHKTRPVYLPEGCCWYDFWTGEKYNGGITVQANAEIETMPLFVRSGSILPLAKVKQYATETPDDVLEIRVYAGADGTFTLYEDENDNYNYEKGIFATIDFSWNEKNQTLTIGDRKGSFEGMLQERIFNVVLVSSAQQKNKTNVVLYNGSKIEVKF
ncbi:MAG: DUF5110 domain-containing protein [Bacteroidales bacterium]|nr:DUF5110 domain-containing protein [Bacteroidales bacterium]